MCSVQNLGEFISCRRTAAAEEILSEVQKILFRLEEELRRSRTAELPPQSSCKEEVLILQRNHPLDQEEPEPPQTHEEQNLRTGLELQHLVLKQESERESNPDWFQNPAKSEGDPGRSFSLNVCEVREKLFCCSFCGKEFKQRKKLTQHIRTHTDERPYSCTWCEKRFHQSAHLSARLRIHTGERPYACSYCEKRFKDLHTQRRHVRSHTGETPYSCQTCGGRFRRRENFLVHTRTHQGQNTLKTLNRQREMMWKKSTRIKKFCLSPLQIYL